MAKKFTPKTEATDAELCYEVNGVFITDKEHGENCARKLWWLDFISSTLGEAIVFAICVAAVVAMR